MSRRSPFVVRLSSEDQVVLEERAGSRLASHASVVRARIVLLAADGVQNVEIASRVGVCVDVASRWRKRFCEEGIAGLVDRARSGRPRRFGSGVVAGIKALACEPPEQRQVPLVSFENRISTAPVIVTFEDGVITLRNAELESRRVELSQGQSFMDRVSSFDPS